MTVLCIAEHTDGTQQNFSIEKPAGALPDSLLTALEAIKVAEKRIKISQIGIHGGPMVTRHAIMDQAKIACPHRVF